MTDSERKWNMSNKGRGCPQMHRHRISGHRGKLRSKDANVQRLGEMIISLGGTVFSFFLALADLNQGVFMELC